MLIESCSYSCAVAFTIIYRRRRIWFPIWFIWITKRNFISTKILKIKILEKDSTSLSINKYLRCKRNTLLFSSLGDIHTMWGGALSAMVIIIGNGTDKNFSTIEFRNHHHHVVPLARISLTLYRHFSLSFIASGRSSGLHPISSHSCWMYVCAGCTAFARPYVGVHRSTSLMSLSLLLQQCSACLVRLTWIVFMMGGRWPYSWCFVGCCRQDLFNIAHSILV